jgi:hypothetical protein
MEIRSFRDLDVWTMAMELVIECYRITSRYPRVGQLLHGLQRSLKVIRTGVRASLILLLVSLSS